MWYAGAVKSGVEVGHKCYSRNKTSGLELPGEGGSQGDSASSHMMRDSTQRARFSEVLLGKVLPQGKTLSEVAGGTMKK